MALMPATKSPRPRKSPAKSPKKSTGKKYKTPGYVPADTLRDTVPTDTGEEAVSLVWFPDAQPNDRIRVQRLDDNTKKWSTHGYFTAGEDTDEHVAELWGGGKYWGQWLRRNTLGSEQIIGSVRPVIPGTYKPPRETYGLKGAEQAGASPLVGRVPEGVNVRDFLNDVILARSLDALATPAAPVAVVPAASTLDKLLELVLPSLPKLLEAWINKTDPAMTSLQQSVAAVQAQLNKPAPTPTQGAMSELIQGLRGLTQIRKQLLGDDGPEKEKEDPMWGVANKALELFGGQGVTRGALPAGEQPAPDGQPVMSPHQRLLIEYAPRLVDSAQRGVEPGLVAELVARYVPEHQRGVLLELVQAPNVAAVIVQVIPAMQNYPTWLAQFVDACESELLGEAEDTTGDPDKDDDA